MSSFYKNNKRGFEDSWNNVEDKYVKENNFYYFNNNNELISNSEFDQNIHFSAINENFPITENMIGNKHQKRTKTKEELENKLQKANLQQKNYIKLEDNFSFHPVNKNENICQRRSSGVLNPVKDDFDGIYDYNARRKTSDGKKYYDAGDPLFLHYDKKRKHEDIGITFNENQRSYNKIYPENHENPENGLNNMPMYNMGFNENFYNGGNGFDEIQNSMNQNFNMFNVKNSYNMFYKPQDDSKFCGNSKRNQNLYEMYNDQVMANNNQFNHGNSYFTPKNSSSEFKPVENLEYEQMQKSNIKNIENNKMYFYNSNYFGNEHAMMCKPQEEQVYRCLPCLKCFKRLSTLKIHIFAHFSSANVFKCPKIGCECGFKSYAQALKHISSVHDEDKERLNIILQNSKFLSNFKAYLALIDYYSMQTRYENPFKGNFCFGCFTYPRSLSGHPCSRTFYNIPQCPACGHEIPPNGLEKHCYSNECVRVLPELKD